MHNLSRKFVASLATQASVAGLCQSESERKNHEYRHPGKTEDALSASHHSSRFGKSDTTSILNPTSLLHFLRTFFHDCASTYNYSPHSVLCFFPLVCRTVTCKAYIFNSWWNNFAQSAAEITPDSHAAERLAKFSDVQVCPAHSHYQPGHVVLQNVSRYLMPCFQRGDEFLLKSLASDQCKQYFHMH